MVEGAKTCLSFMFVCKIDCHDYDYDDDDDDGDDDDDDDDDDYDDDAEDDDDDIGDECYAQTLTISTSTRRLSNSRIEFIIYCQGEIER